MRNHHAPAHHAEERTGASNPDDGNADRRVGRSTRRAAPRPHRARLAAIPEYVFCSEAGNGSWDDQHFSRVWERLRRRAHAAGIRPLRLQCTRHSWATWALCAGKSVRWVADVLGHRDPAFTMRVYAHAMRDEETDLSFVEFGREASPDAGQTAPNVSIRLQGLEPRSATRVSPRKDWWAARDSNPEPAG